VPTRLIDPERYPAVSRAVSAVVFTMPGDGSLDEGFDFGVHWVLDGIEALEECTEYARQDGTSSHVDRQNG
jgi:hypothetical protein